MLHEQETGHPSGLGSTPFPSNTSHVVYQEAPKKSTFQDDQVESGTLGTICHDFDAQATTLPGYHMSSSPASSLNSPTCLTPNARPFLQ